MQIVVRRPKPQHLKNLWLVLCIIGAIIYMLYCGARERVQHGRIS